MTKEMAIDAWKKALEHKKEAGYFLHLSATEPFFYIFLI